MSAKRTASKASRTRFDRAFLIDLAGEKTFARGEAYCEGGKVEILSVDPARIAARVHGTETYAVELDGDGSNPDGKCSCPAHAQYGFCKHLVAVALCANKLGPAELAVIESRADRIRKYLLGQGLEALVANILALARRDASLMDELELQAAMEGEDDAAVLARLRGAIGDAVSTRGYVTYAEAGGWASGVRAVLDRIADLADRGRPAVALVLLEEFFEDMEDRIGEIDDSDGHCGVLIEEAIEIHRSACHAAKPDPVALARMLFARETQSGWDFFHDASVRYEEALGASGLAEYRRLASAEWAKVKPRHPGRFHREGDDRIDRERIGAIMESFAVRDGDVGAQIAIRAKDLSTAYDYLQIAEICLANKRQDEALKWAEEGLWQFEDAPDERLILFACRLHLRAKRKETAEEMLFAAFERRPDLALYKEMASLLGKDAVRERCVRSLEARLDNPKRGRDTDWDRPRDLLVSILMHERRLDEAWAVAMAGETRDATLLALAELSEKSHPAEACKVFAAQAEKSVAGGSRRDYESAVALIRRAGRLRERLGESNAHKAWLGELALRHKAKRNFIKLLGTTVAE